MIPLKDDVPSRSAPIVTLALVALNVLAYLYQFSLGVDARGPGAGAEQALVMEFGLVPCRLTGGCPAPDDFPSPLATVFTSMFLHGSWFHLGGNMLYLWIFGHGVEDTLGHGRFLGFYLGAGTVAALVQAYLNPASAVPMVGASGAISGVLGAYLIMYPKVRVHMLFIFIIFFKVFRIPAWIVLIYWFGVQIATAYMTPLQPDVSSGVAVWAHIGGFIAGMVLIKLFEKPELVAERNRIRSEQAWMLSSA